MCLVTENEISESSNSQGKIRLAYTDLFGELESKRRLRRGSLGWKDDVNMVS
jgi:hypothetical protein